MTPENIWTIETRSVYRNQIFETTLEAFKKKFLLKICSVELMEEDIGEFLKNSGGSLGEMEIEKKTPKLIFI